MLKDLTKQDWLELLKIPESIIPGVLILRGTRNLSSQTNRARKDFETVVDLHAPNGVIEDVFIGKRSNQWIGFASVYGAPMASEITHLFGMLGTQTVIQTGTCGGLADQLQANDLLIVTEAYCGEGAAQYYCPAQTNIKASPELLALVNNSIRTYSNIQTGSLYTTSALFAESRDDLDNWATQGFAAVDLETATTFAVAEFFGMQRISILSVFDNPRQKDHLLLSNTEKEVQRQATEQQSRELVFHIAAELNKNETNSLD